MATVQAIQPRETSSTWDFFYALENFWLVYESNALPLN
jgi:hypothetical protein